MRTHFLAIAVLAAFMPGAAATVANAQPTSENSQTAASSAPDIKLPVPITDPNDAMAYSMLQATTDGEQGIVGLKYTIEKDGSVDDVVVTQTSHNPQLDHASIKTLERRWHFRPEMVNGQPVASVWRTQILWVITDRDTKSLLEPPPQIFMKRNEFPPGAWDRREQGVDWLSVNVDEMGKVTNCALLMKSGFDDLDAAAKAFLTNPNVMRPPVIHGHNTASLIEIMIVWSAMPSKPEPVLNE